MLTAIKRRTVRAAAMHWTYIKNRRAYQAVAPPWRTLRLALDAINLKLYGDFLAGTSIRMTSIPPGSILSGAWDQHVIDLEEDLAHNAKYQGILEHFRDGIPWEDTTLFQHRYRERLEERGTYYGCSSLKELAKKYDETFDALFKDIETHGIRARSWRRPGIAPIYVHIGRRGDFIFTTGGNHRYAIARVLGIRHIPVRVWIRHRNWQLVREQARVRGKSTEQKMALDPIHPDLLDIMAS